MPSKNLGYILTPKAKADLLKIFVFTQKTWGFKKSKEYKDLLKTKVLFICQNPKIGTNCDHLFKDLKSYIAGSHKIYYKIKPKRIEIISVLHQSVEPILHF